jgi:hypothetical protein
VVQRRIGRWPDKGAVNGREVTYDGEQQERSDVTMMYAQSARTTYRTR